MSQIARSRSQIGAIVRRERRRLGRSQDAVAAAAGVRQATLSDLESGRRDVSFQTLLDVLAALDLELNVIPRSKGDDEAWEDIF